MNSFITNQLHPLFFANVYSTPKQQLSKQANKKIVNKMEYRYEALFCIFTFFYGVQLVQGQDGGFCNYGSITKIADCNVPSITFNTIPNDLPDDVQIMYE